MNWSTFNNARNEYTADFREKNSCKKCNRLLLSPEDRKTHTCTPYGGKENPFEIPVANEKR